MPEVVHLIAAARPNFMKVAPLWRALQQYPERFDPRLIHTGQHYDRNMSDVFFADLGLPRPHHHLGVGSGTHAEQTAGVMTAYEKLALAERPGLVIVVGDVNPTVAVAMVASKLHIELAHVEAGLRSRDRTMPEEINRLITDTIADYLFTPSADGDENLVAEGVDPARIHRVGNIMIDSLVEALERVRPRSRYADLGCQAGEYGLVTLHRPANVDDPALLTRLFDGLTALDYPLIFPVHPRTHRVMNAAGIWDRYSSVPTLNLVEPMGYDDFLNLTMNAKLVITDSGGIQEETTYLGIPCLTMRPNTERPITIDIGTNELITLETLSSRAAAAIAGDWKQGQVPDLWDGQTAVRLAAVLARR